MGYALELPLDSRPELLAEAEALVRRRFSPLDAVCNSLHLVRFRPLELLAHRPMQGS